MNQDQNNIAETEKTVEQTDATSAEEIKETAKANMKKSMEETLRTVSRGQLQLDKPIRASNKDVTVLHFDFTKLTGWEFAQALDRDASGNTNAFRLSQVQALELFAAAAAKETPDVDTEDIRRRIGISDAVKATQIAVVFFNLTSRTANSRISN